VSFYFVVEIFTFIMCFSYTFVVRFQYSMMLIMMIYWFARDDEEKKNNLFVVDICNSYLYIVFHTRLLCDFNIV